MMSLIKWLQLRRKSLPRRKWKWSSCLRHCKRTYIAAWKKHSVRLILWITITMKWSKKLKMLKKTLKDLKRRRRGKILESQSTLCSRKWQPNAFTQMRRCKNTRTNFGSLLKSLKSNSNRSRTAWEWSCSWDRSSTGHEWMVFELKLL